MDREPTDDQRAVLRDAMAALDMPAEGLRNWFEHNKRFCRRHGGERRYGEWLALYADALEVIDAP